MKKTFLITITFAIGFFLSSKEKIFETKTLFPKKIKTLASNSALEFWTRSRSYPNADIPEDAYYKAFLFSKNNLKRNENQFTNDIWKSIGPTNFGGRTISIVFNHINTNTIFAGSASGGLWKTFTGGNGQNAWSYVPVKNESGNYFPVLGVGAIAIDPNDTNTIFIGTGEVYGYQKSLGGFGLRTTRGSYGIGILKTTNGGVSWTYSLNWERNQKTGIQDIVFHPNNSNIIYTATTEGVLKSIDNGLSWNLVLQHSMAMDILIVKNFPETLFVSCGNLGSENSGIYKSLDGGNSFTRIDALPNFSGKTTLSSPKNFPNIIYADIADSVSGKGLYRSTDFGTNWKRMNAENYASYQGWYSHFAFSHDEDTNFVLCAGIDIFKSTNSGKNLIQKSYWYNWDMSDTIPGDYEGPNDYSHADHHAYAIHPTNPNIIYFATDGGIFRTTNFGETFEAKNGGYHTQQFYNGSSNSLLDSNLAIGGMQDNASVIYKGRSNGAWNRVFGGDGNWSAIDQKNDSIIYASAQYLYIVKNTKRGNEDEWNFIFGGLGNNTNFVAPYVLSPNWNDTSDTNNFSKTLYAGEDIISKSTDGGTNWTITNNNSPLDGNATLSLAVSENNSNIVYAATLPSINKVGVFKTSNGGNSWTPIDTSINFPNRYPMDIAIDNKNPNRAYIVFGGFDTSHVFMTINGGTSWIDCDRGNLPNVPTNTVVIDPDSSHVVYIGNDLGVYISTDFGNSWNEFTEGMPPSIVMDLSISKSNRKLRAFTHGIGVWERSLANLPNTTIVREENNIPKTFLLYQNYPNPFNPKTKIKFLLTKNSENVSLEIYDILGKKISTLIDNKRRQIGFHEIEFDGSKLQSGTYFYKLTTETFSETKKMIITK